MSVYANMWSHRWKHIVVLDPKQSGSLYFNCKDTFSVVRLAVCDAY